MALATLRFIEKYPELYSEAFPLSIDLGPPDVPPHFPPKPSSIPAVVREPLYCAGFFIDSVYFHRHLVKLGWDSACGMLPSLVVLEWKRRERPKPFIPPRIFTSTHGPCLIFFVHQHSSTEEVQKFLTHRDRTLDLFCDIVRFGEKEQAFVRRNVRWQWYSLEEREVGPGVCLGEASVGGEALVASAD